MGQIQAMFQCFSCEETILAPTRPKTCPGCGYDWGDAASKFKAPYMLSEQNERFKNRTAYRDAILDLPVAKMNAVLNDALNIIETLSAKNVRISDISQVVKMAIEIGKIATAYDAFIRAGGKHGPSLFFKEGDKKDEPADGGVSEVTEVGQSAGKD
jgi:hypothetical protein